MSDKPFALLLHDLERAAAVIPDIDLDNHRRLLRAAANVVHAARSAAFANDFPAGAGMDEVLSHLADNLDALDAAAAPGSQSPGNRDI